MHQHRFFEEGTIPEFTTAEWYDERERADHFSDEMHRGRLLVAADFVKKAILLYDIRTVCDLGCGDAGLLQHLKPWLDEHNVKCWGYDLMPTNVRAAIYDRKIDVVYADVVNDDIDFADLVICTEFLEHIIDPHALVSKIYDKSKVLVASSPNGESLETGWYEYHTWGFDMDGYKKMIEDVGFRVTDQGNYAHFQIQLGIKE